MAEIKPATSEQIEAARRIADRATATINTDVLLCLIARIDELEGQVGHWRKVFDSAAELRKIDKDGKEFDGDRRGHFYAYEKERGRFIRLAIAAALTQAEGAPMKTLPYPYARANRRIVRSKEAKRIAAGIVATALLSAVLPVIDLATDGAVARGITAALALMGEML